MPDGIDNQTQTLEIGERTNRDYLRFVPQRDELYRDFGAGFINQNLSEAQRNAKRNDTSSALYKKGENARLLNKAAGHRQHRQMILMQECFADRLVQCPDDVYRDISSFMLPGQKNTNKEILDCYFGKQNQQNPQETEGQNTKRALEIMAFQLFRIDISRLRLDNDAQMAKNADVLEQLSDQVGAFDRLLDKHPEFTEDLPERKKTLFLQRMEALRAISLYYQTRKGIINDPYYQDHFDNELSMEIRPEDTPEQLELAKKLIQSYAFEKALISAGAVPKNGNLIHNSAVTLTNDISRQFLLSLNAACTRPQTQKGFILQSRLSVNDALFRQKARNEHKALFDRKAAEIISMRDDFLKQKYARTSDSWKKKHLTNNHLRLCTMKVVNCMAYLRKEDESTSFRMLDNFLLRTDGAKTEVRIKKARAYESLFDFIRKFDLTEFQYNTNEACFQSRYLKPYAMGVMMKSLPKEYFDDYTGLMRDPKAECTMKPNEVHEVMARWQAIRSACSGNLPAGAAIDDLLQQERAKLKLDEADRIKEKQRDRLELRRQQLLFEKGQGSASAREMADIQQNMDNVQGRGFVTVQRPAHRIGLFGKIRNFVMMGIRGIVRAITFAGGSAVANQVSNAYYVMSKNSIENAQRKRRHDMVPGSDGEFFDDEQTVAKDEQGEDLEVYSDVRRGPLVWEKMTAGDPDDPPEVTIMAEQPVRGSQEAIGGKGFGEGHALIMLSYSRYSKLTRRKERYQLRMGFYQKGGIGLQSRGAMLGGAYLGARLSSDETHVYDVARRYVVKPGDINKILKKAETYADGGYNLFKRNCTTFVIDMAKEINLPLAEIYNEEQPQLNVFKEAVMQAGVGVANLTQYGGASDIISRLDKNDLSYHNFGQKMYTKEDLDRFYDTFRSGDYIKSGYNPGLLGEDLRKAKNGDLSARLEEHTVMNKETLLARQEKAANAIWTAIEKIIPLDQRNDQDDQIHAMLIETKDAGYFSEAAKEEQADADNYRRIHKQIRTVSTKISRYYAERLGSDNRLNDSIIEYLSILEVLQTNVDIAYRGALRNEAKGNTGALQFDFYNEELDIDYKKGDDTTTVSLPPALYEGFLKAGFTPEEVAITQNRYLELGALGTNLTEEQKKEKKKLGRIFSLAKDFANASRHLLEKEEYTDKDLCYAFRDLPQKEIRVRAVAGTNPGDITLHGTCPSYYYQCVMLDKMVFGDFRQLHLHEVQGGIERKRAALDAYMRGQLDVNGESIRTILKYYMEGEENSAVKFVGEFLFSYISGCLENAYRGTGMSQEVCEAIATAMTNDSDTKTRLFEIMEELGEIRNTNNNNERRER